MMGPGSIASAGGRIRVAQEGAPGSAGRTESTSDGRWLSDRRDLLVAWLADRLGREGRCDVDASEQPEPRAAASSGARPPASRAGRRPRRVRADPVALRTGDARWGAARDRP